MAYTSRAAASGSVTKQRALGNQRRKTGATRFAGVRSIGGRRSSRTQQPESVRFSRKLGTSEEPCIEKHQPLIASKSAGYPNRIGSIRTRKLATSDAPHLEKIRLNFGGCSFTISAGTVLNREPSESLLHQFVHADVSKRLSMADDYIESTGEYFFERSSATFMPIYNYFITGNLHKPTDMCPSDFLYELNYWQLPLKCVAHCCRSWVSSEDYVFFDEVSVQSSNYNSPNVERRKVACEQRSSRWYRFRIAAFNLSELPNSSVYAYIFSLVSISAVIISNAALIIGTLPVFQQNNDQINQTNNQSINPVHNQLKQPLNYQLIFEWIETVCVIWFTFEYVLKVAIAFDRWKVIKAPMNVVDLLAVLPFYLEFAFVLLPFDVENFKDFKTIFMVIRILRVLRVIRIFKLGRYSQGLQLFAKVLYICLPKLTVFSMVLLVAMLFFSTIVFYADNMDESIQPAFRSIPDTFWWCFTTLALVGYGDQVPVTSAGKMVSFGCVMSGVIVLAIPITIVVENYMRQLKLLMNSTKQ